MVPPSFQNRVDSYYDVGLHVSSKLSNKITNFSKDIPEKGNPPPLYLFASDITVPPNRTKGCLFAHAPTNANITLLPADPPPIAFLPLSQSHLTTDRLAWDISGNGFHAEVQQSVTFSVGPDNNPTGAASFSGSSGGGTGANRNSPILLTLGSTMPNEQMEMTVLMQLYATPDGARRNYIVALGDNTRIMQLYLVKDLYGRYWLVFNLNGKLLVNRDDEVSWNLLIA